MLQPGGMPILDKSRITQRLEFSAAAVANIGATKDVYITKRTDAPPANGSLCGGQGGSGMPMDPCDGSTQKKFDAIFKAHEMAGTTNVTFHIAEGRFQAKGGWDYLTTGWHMLSGWNIKGAGKDQTIIEQVVGTLGTAPGSTNGQLFRHAESLDTDDQSVEDLTVDCAWFRSGPGGDNSRPYGNFYAVGLYGANCRIRNVKATGAGWAVNETFVLWIRGGIGHLPDNALIEGCEVSDVAQLSGVGEGYVSGIAMTNDAAHGNNPTPTYASNGRLISNVSIGCYNGMGPPGGFDSGEFAGNRVVANNHAVFHDTLWSKGIRLHHNELTATNYDGGAISFNIGKTLGDAVLSEFLIDHNICRSARGIAAASAFKNSKISYNRIMAYNPAHKLYSIRLPEDPLVTGNVAANNFIDDGLPDLIGKGNISKSNRKTDGSLRPKRPPAKSPSRTGKSKKRR